MMYVGVAAALLVLGAVFFFATGGPDVWFKSKAPGPVKPAVTDGEQGKGDGDSEAAAADADAGEKAEADALAVAEADAGEEGEEAAPEEVREAIEEARDRMWNLALMNSAYDPTTGASLLLPEGAEPEEGDGEGSEDGDDKGATPVANTPRVNPNPGANTPKPAGNTPKPVKDEPVTAVPDSSLNDLDDAAKKREVTRLLRTAQQKVNSKRFTEALQDLSQARSLAPGNPAVQRLTGIAYHQSGRSKQAIPFLENAVRARSSDAALVRMLGDAYMATGNRSKGVETYKKYLALQPKGPASDTIRQIVNRY